jgi:hypothetical protein
MGFSTASSLAGRLRRRSKGRSLRNQAHQEEEADRSSLNQSSIFIFPIIERCRSDDPVRAAILDEADALGGFIHKHH